MYYNLNKKQKKQQDAAARGPVPTQCPHVVHKVKKGKGSFTRKTKHKVSLNTDF